MDVLSLEHYFGKEVETSLRQLFNYFCNQINLGQWAAAKACLLQLESNRKNFDFDYRSVLNDLIKSPELYKFAYLYISNRYLFFLASHLSLSHVFK